MYTATLNVCAHLRAAASQKQCIQQLLTCAHRNNVCIRRRAHTTFLVCAQLRLYTVYVCLLTARTRLSSYALNCVSLLAACVSSSRTYDILRVRTAVSLYRLRVSLQHAHLYGSFSPPPTLTRDSYIFETTRFFARLCACVRTYVEVYEWGASVPENFVSISVHGVNTSRTDIPTLALSVNSQCMCSFKLYLSSIDCWCICSFLHKSLEFQLTIFYIFRCICSFVEFGNLREQRQ